jgi:hypothetical protein
MCLHLALSAIIEVSLNDLRGEIQARDYHRLRGVLCETCLPTAHPAPTMGSPEEIFLGSDGRMRQARVQILQR